MEAIAQFEKCNPIRDMTVRLDTLDGSISAVVTTMHNRSREVFQEHQLFVRRVTSVGPQGLRLPMGHACLCARERTPLAQEEDKVVTVAIAQNRGLSPQIHHFPVARPEGVVILNVIVFRI